MFALIGLVPQLRKKEKKKREKVDKILQNEWNCILNRLRIQKIDSHVITWLEMIFFLMTNRDKELIWTTVSVAVYLNLKKKSELNQLFYLFFFALMCAIEMS